MRRASFLSDTPSPRADRRRGSATAYVLGAIAVLVALAAADPAAAACTTTSTSHCLQGERFRVEIEWEDYVGAGGLAHTVAGGTADSGLFWFYGADNWEVLVKVLSACHQNDFYWVFAAAATTLQYTIIVTDTETGAVRTYSNPLDVSSPAVTDIEAFHTCGGTAAGAQVRYYNNLFCAGGAFSTGAGEPFTSTLAVGNYDWQSLTQVPSPYQLVQKTSLGTEYVEVNGSPCGDHVYGGTLNFVFGRKYAIAQTLELGQRVLLLLDEGAASTTEPAAAADLEWPSLDGLPVPTPPYAPPRVVGRLVADVP